MKEKGWIQISRVQGYENIKDQYWISNSDDDKVMNRSTGKQLKIRIGNLGYKLVDLYTKDGKRKTCRVHIIKAKALIYTPNPLNANVVRHLNDVKTDNRLSNLAFGTQLQNNLDCIRNGNFNYEAAAKNLTKGNVKGHAKNLT